MLTVTRQRRILLELAICPKALGKPPWEEDNPLQSPAARKGLPSAFLEALRARAPYYSPQSAWPNRLNIFSPDEFNL
jgi:hypothetical protein